MTRPIFNIADLTEFREVGHKGQAIGATRPDQSYEARLGAISTKIGAQKLGYNLTIVPPGKRAFPRHSHRVNEEMFFIIEGEGELIVGAERGIR
ncbi:MAG TPA: cupin domain-containing protein [Stellaceae bacterium]|nr:cupin domain-containing protein [Stellaceae bacterium]